MDEKPGTHKVLGVRWNVDRDGFCFSIGEVVHMMEGLEPTKRNFVSVTAKFFDLLRFVSPATVFFKLFSSASSYVKTRCDRMSFWKEEC